jgi:hypothetical protein
MAYNTRQLRKAFGAFNQRAVVYIQWIPGGLCETHNFSAREATSLKASTVSHLSHSRAAL